MVRHWILIPAFPGSNPGSAVKFKDIADAVSFFVIQICKNAKHCVLLGGISLYIICNRSVQ